MALYIHLHRNLRSRFIVSVLFSMMVGASSTITISANEAPQEDSQVYMGAVFTHILTRTPGNNIKPTSIPVANDPCAAINQGPQQRAMTKLITTKPAQPRPVFRCNAILTTQAMRKAKDMIDRRYYGHVDIDGFGMNYFLRKAGYPLPSYYLTTNDANNVESLAAGPDFPTAETAFQALIDSSRHRPQILGLTPGWAAQDEYGIGYAYGADSKYENYWVILTAKNGD